MICKGLERIAAVMLGATRLSAVHLGAARVWPTGSASVPVTGIAVTGPSSVDTPSNSAKLYVTFTPEGTTQTSVVWSVTAGGSYASVDRTGALTVKPGANAASVTVRAASVDNAAVYGEKTVTVTYNTGIGVTVTYPLTVPSTTTRVRFTVLDPDGHGWSIWDISGRLVSSGWLVGAGVVSGDATAESATCEVSGTGSAVVYLDISPNTGTDSRNFNGLRIADRLTDKMDSVRFTQTTGTAQVPVTGVSISGPSSVDTDANKAQYTVVYTPLGTSQTEVTWGVTSGGSYASVDGYGLLTVKPGASSASVTLRAVSTANASVHATKTVTVTYRAAVVVYSLTVTPTPADASVAVTVDGATVAYTPGMRIPSGSSVKVSVSRAGYVSNTQAFTMSSDRTLQVELQAGAVYRSLTVNATPSGASVSVAADGVPLVYSAGMLIADGSSVAVEVSCDGYASETRSFVIVSDTVLSVSLSAVLPTSALTVSVSPSDAALSVVVDGKTRTYSAGMRIVRGSTVTVTASRTGYYDQTVTIAMDSDKTLSVSLVRVTFSLRVLTLPSRADVALKVDGAAVAYTPGMRIPSGAAVVVTVSMRGFATEERSLVMDADKVVSVELGVILYPLTVNPTPADASVQVLIGDQPEPYSGGMPVASGSRVTVTVSKTGYASETRSFEMTSAVDLDVVLRLEVPTEGLGIEGPAEIGGGAASAAYAPVFTPPDATDTLVVWSVESGSQYASMDPDTGVLTARPGAFGSHVVIRAELAGRPEIFATKTVKVSFPSHYADPSSLSLTASAWEAVAVEFIPADFQNDPKIEYLSCEVPSWMAVVSRSQQAGDGRITYTFSAEANDGAAREGDIVFTYQEPGDECIVSVHVTQQSI